jgi:hypothetical protein
VATALLTVLALRSWWMSAAQQQLQTALAESIAATKVADASDGLRTGWIDHQGRGGACDWVGLIM